MPVLLSCGKPGVPAKKAARPSYTQIAIEALVKIARQDKRIVAITAAMCEGTGLNAFEKVFPDRIYDVGIAEQHAVTFAAGMAAQGMKPGGGDVCHLFTARL